MADVWLALDNCASWVDRLAELIPAGGTERFLFDAAWQSTLIGLATCGLLLAVRQRASHRAALAWLGIMLAVTVPVGTAAVRAANWGQRAAVVAAANAENLPPIVTASNPAESLPMTNLPLPALPDDHATNTDGAATIPVVPNNGEAVESPLLKALPPEPLDERPTPALILPIGGLLLAAWGMLSLFYLLRLVRSYVLLAQLKRRAQPCDDPQIHSTVQRAAQAIGLQQPPAIACSSAIESPAIVAWGRGLLLLPPQQPAGTDIYAVACHELAHLRRRDGWSRLTIEIAAALMPWQVSLWRLRAEFRRSCEEACDDWVVALGTDPVELASTLANWLRPAPASPALGMSESVSVTRRRIMRLLAQHNSPQPRLGRLWVLAILMVGLSCGAALAFWQTPAAVELPEQPVAASEKYVFIPPEYTIHAQLPAPPPEQPVTELRAAGDEAYLHLLPVQQPKSAESPEDQFKRLLGPTDSEPRRWSNLKADITIRGKDLSQDQLYDQVAKPLQDVILQDPWVNTVDIGPKDGAIVLTLSIRKQVGLNQAEQVLKRLASIQLPKGASPPEITRVEINEQEKPPGDETLTVVVHTPEAKSATGSDASDQRALVAKRLNLLSKQLTDRKFELVELEQYMSQVRSRAPDESEVEQRLRNSPKYLEKLKQREDYQEQLRVKQSMLKDQDAPVIKRVQAQIDHVDHEISLLKQELLPEASKQLQDERTARAAIHRTKQTIAMLEEHIQDLQTWQNSVAAAKEVGVPHAAQPPYRIAPPDILMIDSIGLERTDPKIRDGDTLAIDVEGTPQEQPISGQFKVGPKGRVSLGPNYGTVSLTDLDCDQAAAKIRKHLEGLLREPNVSVSLAERRPLQPIAGEHLVGPDGRTSLGSYGMVTLNGLTVEEAQKAVERHLRDRGFEATISVEVSGYNSHVYYLAIERSGENTFVIRTPITGNETVLDALSQLDGSLSPASKIQLHRPKADGGDETLEVDWQSIVQGKSLATNYKLKTGDRLFVKEVGPKESVRKR